MGFATPVSMGGDKIFLLSREQFLEETPDQIFHYSASPFWLQKINAPVCISALFVYNFTRQDLHKKMGAEVVTPLSTGQQNKRLTAQICFAHVTSWKPLRPFHNFPGKIQTARPCSSAAPCAPYAPACGATSSTVLSGYVIWTEPLSSLRKPWHCTPLLKRFHLCGTSFSLPWPHGNILLIL